MADEAYTLVLTQGIHVVRPDVATLIREAIDEGKRTIDIDIDIFGGLNSSRRTTVAVAHVVALVESKKPQREIVAESNGKVRAIRRIGSPSRRAEA